MAIIRVTRVGGENGAIVRIHDDAYAHCSPEEIERRKRATGLVIRRILEDQIKRGITPVIRKIELPEVEVLYDRERDGEYPGSIPEPGRGGEGECSDSLRNATAAGS